MASTLRPFILITGKTFFENHLRSNLRTQIRFQSITGKKPTDELLLKATGGRITQWWDYFNNVTGLAEVKRAQDLVLEVCRK